MTSRLVRVAPVLVVAFALAVCSGWPIAPSLAGVFALGSALSPWRLPLDKASQRVALLVVLVLVIAGIRASSIPLRGPHLGAFGYGFALATLLMATFRSVLSEPEGGLRLDLVFCFLSLLGSGAARPGLWYSAIVVAFVASLAVARRAVELDTHRSHRSLVEFNTPRSRRFALVQIGVVAATAFALAVLAQFAYGRLERHLRSSFESTWDDQVGIADTVRLGGMRRMLQSDELVLRVSGPPVDLLRGFALDDYAAGRWTRARSDIASPHDVPRAIAADRSVVEVRHVDPEIVHIFLPLGARNVATPRGEVLVDSMGITQAVPKDTSPIVWFYPGTRDAFEVAGPTPQDRAVPRRIRPELTAIATEWVRGTHTQEEALDAIQRRLMRDYTYSLEPLPETSLDPILEFLTVSRRGHCEYFATALALLARSIDIPARLVLGFHVGEQNPHLGHWVVRQKNAHAWVEASPSDGSGNASGRWVTFDPTPTIELPQNLRHEEAGLTALRETLAMGFDRMTTWLGGRSVYELGAAAVLGVVVFALQRWRRARRERLSTTDDELGYRLPLDGFVRLDAVLAKRGLGRQRGESIEDWVARLADPPIGATLLRYVRARYGDASDGGLEAALDEAARIARRRRRIGS